jgi:hypothetical protein
MKRVTGIGGIFFKAKDAPALQAWYKRHLGIDVQEWGGTAFTWADSDGKPTGGTTIWSVGPKEVDQFAPSKASFMVNYRVEDLHTVVTALKAEGCNVLDKSKVVARCRPEDQPGLLKPPHVTPMNFTGRVMKGWLHATGPSTKKVAGLRTSIARGETALRAPTRKPGGGTR